MRQRHNVKEPLIGKNLLLTRTKTKILIPTYKVGALACPFSSHQYLSTHAWIALDMRTRKVKENIEELPYTDVSNIIEQLAKSHKNYIQSKSKQIR